MAIESATLFSGIFFESEGLEALDCGYNQEILCEWIEVLKEREWVKKKKRGGCMRLGLEFGVLQRIPHPWKSTKREKGGGRKQGEQSDKC